MKFQTGDLIKFDDDTITVIDNTTNNIVCLKENDVAIVVYSHFKEKIIYFYVTSLQCLCYCHVTRVSKI